MSKYFTLIFLFNSIYLDITYLYFTLVLPLRTKPHKIMKKIIDLFIRAAITMLFVSLTAMSIEVNNANINYLFTVIFFALAFFSGYGVKIDIEYNIKNS